MKKKKSKKEPKNSCRETEQSTLCYVNRELSWLKFNERVLNEAGNPRVPLAERLAFASIYQSDLDEFYRVRVGILMDQMECSEKIFHFFVIYYHCLFHITSEFRTVKCTGVSFTLMTKNFFTAPYFRLPSA